MAGPRCWSCFSVQSWSDSFPCRPKTLKCWSDLLQVALWPNGYGVAPRKRRLQVRVLLGSCSCRVLPGSHARACMYVCNQISGQMVWWYHIRFVCRMYSPCALVTMYCPSGLKDRLHMEKRHSRSSIAAPVASWIRHRTSNPRTVGSNPPGGDHAGPAWPWARAGTTIVIPIFTGTRSPRTAQDPGSWRGMLIQRA